MTLSKILIEAHCFTLLLIEKVTKEIYNLTPKSEFSICLYGLQYSFTTFLWHFVIPFNLDLFLRGIEQNVL